ncbi:uncharacterized protein LOC122757849, partial [Drosophila mojavensis]|uniref:uncharacterized protein LOC122757849 n=1 Tax=Drosophila mojavensis TaxID=7230 RepID=UPI001CD0692D
VHGIHAATALRRRADRKVTTIPSDDEIVNYEHDNEDPTSEVGLVQPNTNADSCCVDLEKQIRDLKEMVAMLSTPLRAPSNAKQVCLPKFNPDTPSADAFSWRTTVGLIIADNALQGSDLVMSLSRALEGSASQWLEQVSFAGMTWAQFQELFILRFEGLETKATTLVNLFSGAPKEGENLCVYSSRLVTSLLTKWRSTDVEEIAVSVVLAHLAQIDKKLSKLLFTKEIKTRGELHA